jgi:hypothetical protein
MPLPLVKVAAIAKAMAAQYEAKDSLLRKNKAKKAKSNT